MRRTVFRLTLLALAFGAPGIAVAQVAGGDSLQSGGIPHRQDIRPLGIQMGMYNSGEYTAHFEKDQCGREGCLIVINKSQAFDIAQLYINDGAVDAHGVPVWGANQFQGFSLRSNRALWTPRPRKMKCDVMVRVVMRRHDSSMELESIQPIDLCNMPKAGFAVLEVQAEDPDARGRVTIGDGPRN
jgi:hypothetical protein